MTPDQMHAKMARIVNAPGYPLLKDYRRDFEVLDLDILRAQWHGEGRALWIVREMGTDIVNLGVHPKSSEHGKAVLGMGGAKQCYLLTPRRITQIDQARAAGELKSFEWSIDQGRISRKGQPVADLIELRTAYAQDPKSRIVADIRLEPLRPVEKLSHPEIMGLFEFVRCEAINQSQSLFCVPRSVTLDGRDMFGILDQKRDAWLSQEKLQAAKDQSQGAMSF